MRVHPLICLTVCGFAAILAAAAWPATASAEAVTLSGAAGPPLKGAPGGFVYTPGAPPSAYPPMPHASEGESPVAAPTSTAAAAGTASAAWQTEPPAPWTWARPAEWGAQGGTAVLLYRLSRRRRRRRGRKRVGW